MLAVGMSGVGFVCVCVCVFETGITLVNLHRKKQLVKQSLSSKTYVFEDEMTKYQSV